MAVAANLGDYAAVNPSLDKSVLKDKVVVLNLGSYNSRELMAVVWYKLRKKYPDAVGAAHLLVQPADSFASPRSGKNVLRAALPGYDVKDAWSRCRILIGIPARLAQVAGSAQRSAEELSACRQFSAEGLGLFHHRY